MYSTCIHCHAPLGQNDVIGSWPVGRRLAFDAHRGRLWVVCARCREWNLTPIEERWEAIEECERRFRSTRLRASTDNVGLATLPEGLELVRIGEPLRPEMAAWRYGAEFRRRRREAIASSAIYMTPLYVFNILQSSQLLPMAVTGVGIGAAVAATVWRVRSGWQPRVALEDGRVTRLRVRDFMHARLTPHGDSWALDWWRGRAEPLAGASGTRALRSIAAKANARGGREDEVSGALDLLDRFGGGDRFLARLARVWRPNEAAGLLTLSPDVRLAVEMALHEETERRALDGELAALEADWRTAEEVAAIADNLLSSAELPVDAQAPRRGGRSA